MRIAIYSNSFPVLSETFVINQIVGLIDEGVDVDIITSKLVEHDVMHETVKQYSLLAKVKSIGFDFQTSKAMRLIQTFSNILILLLTGKMKKMLSVLSDSHLSKSRKQNLLEALRLGKKAVSYDIVICHFGDKGYYVTKMRDLGLFSGPVSTIFHGHEMSSAKAIKKNLAQYKALFDCGDLMLPISELWKERLISWGCDPLKIKVHRMGVNLDDFDMKPISTPISKPLKVVQVGRLTEKKAIIDSINAVVKASQFIEIEFTIIGDGELFSKAQELIESSVAQKFINLLGKQPQTVVKKYLDESDVFILPSVTAKSGDMEGVPVSLMESMAKGLITISTNHSGIPELIDHNVSGFLVDEHDVDSLSNCLVQVHSMSIDRLVKMREKAFSVCENKFNNKLLNRDVLTLITR